jgi:hypothetical protein
VNIGWAIPCRYVEVHDNLATIVGAGIDTFWFEELPSTVGLDQEYATANRIKDPNGGTVHEATGTFALQADSAKPEFLAGVTLPVALQFEVSEEGTYAIEFEFGDAWASLPMHVVVGNPSGA